MDKHMNHPWGPRLTAFPLLILDDHATEWAARIADRERDLIDGDDEKSVRLPGEPVSEQSDAVADPSAADGPVAGRVRWRDVSSSLCS